MNGGGGEGPDGLNVNPKFNQGRTPAHNVGKTTHEGRGTGVSTQGNRKVKGLAINSDGITDAKKGRRSQRIGKITIKGPGIKGARETGTINE